MLDVKQPDARAAGDQQNRNFDEQERGPADLQHNPAHNRSNGDVGPDHAAALAPAGALIPEAVGNCKNEERTDREQDDWAAHDAIADLLVPRRSEVLLHGHRVHVADAAPIEVTGRRMVDGMAVLPLLVWRQYQHADYQSQPVVGFYVFEERTVTAVMENDETSHHKARGGHSQE